MARKSSPQATARRTAFTLVELLVVISIIAVLLSILLPSLAGARASAWSVVDLSNLRQIGQAAVQYNTENDGWIPGSPGTTGRQLLNDASADEDLAEEVEGDAVQPFDWAGPLAFNYLYPNVDRPEKRSERFQLLNGTGLDPGDPLETGPLAVFQDPANRAISVPYDGSPKPEGTGNFKPQLAQSYVASREMLWWASQPSGGGLPSWAEEAFWGNQAGTCFYPGWDTLTLPGGNTAYAPRIDRLTQPAEKIFVADGTRFQSASLTLLDHDVRTTGSYGGAFADPGAWDVEFTRAYPLGESVAGVHMTSRSFRHGGAARGREGVSPRGNAAFFDGHAESLSIEEARRPELWLPSGSKLRQDQIWRPIRGEYDAPASSGPYGRRGRGFVSIW